MASFYGTINDPYSNTKEVSKVGHKGIKACARSYHGSVITELSYNDNNELMVEISLDNDSSTKGTRMFKGTFEELKNLFEKHNKEEK